MCQACEKNYNDLEDDAKGELARDFRIMCSAVVSAMTDAGKNPVEVAVALTIGYRYWRAQLDAGTLAVVDDLAERGFAMVAADAAKAGVVLAPRPHGPMTFGPVPPPAAHLGAPHVLDRPVRTPEERPTRRVTRRLDWKN